jgi:hypothetical protein
MKGLLLHSWVGDFDEVFHTSAFILQTLVEVNPYRDAVI